MEAEGGREGGNLGSFCNPVSPFYSLLVLVQEELDIILLQVSVLLRQNPTERFNITSSDICSELKVII